MFFITYFHISYMFDILQYRTHRIIKSYYFIYDHFVYLSKRTENTKCCATQVAANNTIFCFNWYFAANLFFFLFSFCEGEGNLRKIGPFSTRQTPYRISAHAYAYIPSQSVVRSVCTINRTVRLNILAKRKQKKKKKRKILDNKLIIFEI